MVNRRGGGVSERDNRETPAAHLNSRLGLGFTALNHGVFITPLNELQAIIN